MLSFNCQVALIKSIVLFPEIDTQFQITNQTGTINMSCHCNGDFTNDIEHVTTGQAYQQINYVMMMMSVISARIHPPDMITCRYFHTYIRYQINQSFYEGRLGLSLMDSYYCIQIVRVY